MDFRMTRKMALIAVMVAAVVVAWSAIADAADEKKAERDAAAAAEIMAAMTALEEPTVIVTAEPLIAGRYYPETGIDADLQDFIREKCEDAGIEFELVLALIMWEHRGHPDAEAVSNTNDYGLMQINQINFLWLADEYGLVNMFDPYQNVQAGIIILDKVATDDDPVKTLMSYNMGPAGAAAAWAEGVTSTTYSDTIIEIMEDIKTGTYSAENFNQYGQYVKGV